MEDSATEEQVVCRIPLSGTSATGKRLCRSSPASKPETALPPPGLDSAVNKLSLEEKAVKEEPLSKAQAKRLRKKLREGRADL